LTLCGFIATQGILKSLGIKKRHKSSVLFNVKEKAMKNFLKVKCIFENEYDSKRVLGNNNLVIPSGSEIKGYLSQPFNTFVFYNNGIQYNIINIDQYAKIIIE